MFGVNYDATVIRTQCVNDHDALLQQAVASLTGKGCTVHTAATPEEARSIIRNLVAPEQKTMCTFAGELNEIDLTKVLPDVIQSDLEALIAGKMNLAYTNPHHAPLDDVTQEQIVAILQSALEGDEAVETSALIPALRKQIQQQADSCAWGISSADAIIANTGTLILAEDQGNGRIVSNIPYCHIAVVGLDKIYPTNDTAQEAIRASWIAGARKDCPTYYSYITGPSRTGDIEGIMVAGMHGPQQVHVILLDNGRSAKLAANANVMKCIECGRCSAALASALAGTDNLPQPLTCKSAALAGLKADGIAFDCPVGITAADL